MVQGQQAGEARLRWLPAGQTSGDDDRTVQRGPASDDDPTRATKRWSSNEDDPTINYAGHSSATTTLDDELTDPYEGRRRVAAHPELLIDGRYRLAKQIGVGGMGEVWEARHISLDRPVAIKFLTHEEGGPRFRREAQAIVAVDHDGIVDVLDFGVTPEGVPYFAMELLRGHTLDRLIHAKGPLPWPVVRRIALELSDALAHTHERGVIHRDLKPSNVFLLDPPPARGSSTKLIDFGIAKLLDQSQPKLTKTGFIHGTPAYMSPEQVLGEAVDGRSDVYGLGCLLYFMLTGRRPFEGVKGAEALYSQIYVMPPRFCEVVPGHAIPGVVEQLVFKALAKRPDERFASMASMHAAIASLPAEVIQMPPPSFPPASAQPPYPLAPQQPAFDSGSMSGMGSASMTGASMASASMASASMASASMAGTSASGRASARPIEKRSPIGVIVGATILVVGLVALAYVGWMML